MSKIFMLGLMMISFSCSYAQDLTEVWQNTLESLNADNIIKVFAVQGDSYKKISKKDTKEILEAMKSIEVLQNPDCRCLPETEACLVFLLKENKIFSIEIVKEHWFQANILLQGCSIRFILKDKKNILAEKVMNILNPTPKEVKAEEAKPEEEQTTICEECSQMMFIMGMGTCECCKGPTTSMSFKYCKACALKKGVCQVCGKKLKK